MAAKDMLPDAKISVIDSLNTSIGLELMVQATLDTIAAGASREEIVAKIEEMKPKVQLLFVVDTLEYLAKGGRIGNAKAFLGTLLKVKPILALQDGAIEPLEQVRSKGKAVNRMVELVVESVGENCSEARVGVLNALAPDEAHACAREIQGRLGCTDPFVSNLGPVIGTHTGPGAIGMVAYA
jgi:DegV family protein with EDD domain